MFQFLPQALQLYEVAALIDLGDATSQTSPHTWGSSGTLHVLDNNRLVLREMLSSLIETFEAVARSEKQTELVGTELAQVYEELVLLHKLNTHMKVTESDANFLQMACDSLTDVVSVEGIGILLDRVVDGERKLVVAAGSGVIDLDEYTMRTLHDRLSEQLNRGHDALLDSEVFGEFEYTWPTAIRNIVAVPLFGKETPETSILGRKDRSHHMVGVMVAVNSLHKKDFDSTDIKLFNSVANGCAVFVENGRLFMDLEELFLGSLRALTSSIDAKDCYTHGHSERVATIAKWIADHVAQEYHLDGTQVHEVYFAGLLHDIGKIGIDDWILSKNGPLTDLEREAIHKHPVIGAGILRGIKQMKNIVPGVLSHHERIDGKGYPHSLSGEQIPVIARIVGLADSFDAMTSRRSYRDARSLKDAMREIDDQLGKQFDPRDWPHFPEK